MSPLVSIIIPCYNVEKYLNQCLDSVVNQTLKDIEIICINDGSTDKTLQILTEYAEKDKRIKVISQENQGAGAARNKGLDIAKGEYLAILDADDIYKSNMLDKMYVLSKEKNLDIAICRSQQLNEKANKIIKTDWCIKKEWLSQKEIFNYKDIPNYIIGFCVGWTWDKLFKRDFIENYKLKFPEIHNSEDGMFTFGALCVANRISIVDNVLVTHRINTTTQLSERRDESPKCFIKGAKILKEFLEQNNRYKTVEQSFINWFVDHSYWHLDTLNLKNSRNIEIKLRDIFEKWGIFEHTNTYFHYPKIYDKLTYMVGNVPYCVYKSLFNITKKIESPYASIRNTHKVFNLFGIKIKIRRKV